MQVLVQTHSLAEQGLTEWAFSLGRTNTERLQLAQLLYDEILNELKKSHGRPPGSRQLDPKIADVYVWEFQQKTTWLLVQVQREGVSGLDCSDVGRSEF